MAVSIQNVERFIDEGLYLLIDLYANHIPGTAERARTWAATAMQYHRLSPDLSVLQTRRLVVLQSAVSDAAMRILPRDDPAPSRAKKPRAFASGPVRATRVPRPDTSLAPLVPVTPLRGAVLTHIDKSLSPARTAGELARLVEQEATPRLRGAPWGTMPHTAVQTPVSPKSAFTPVPPRKRGRHCTNDGLLALRALSGLD